jgi:hypothetical protein
LPIWTVCATRRSGSYSETVDVASLLCAQGRLDHAVELASLSARQAPAEGVESQALSRVARSEVCSSAGDHDHAVELAREAVDLVPDTMPNLLGEALWTLGRVLAVANLPGADSARSDALACYVRKREPRRGVDTSYGRQRKHTKRMRAVAGSSRLKASMSALLTARDGSGGLSGVLASCVRRWGG